MICPKCQFKNDDDAKFCEHCGTKLQKAHRFNLSLKRVIWASIAGIIVITIFLTMKHFRDPMARFDFILNNYDGELRTVRKNGKWGFIKSDGWWNWWNPIKIDLIFDDAGRFYDKLAPVCLDGKWGFIEYYDSRNWKEAIPFQYDYARDFGEGLAPVSLNGKWGYINNVGQNVIPFEYEDALSFFEGLAAVQLNNKWGFIDANNNIIIPFKYDNILWKYGGGYPICVFAESGRGGTTIVLDGKKLNITKKMKDGKIFFSEEQY